MAAEGSRVAAIVSGHSRGLGEGIAAELLARGARVMGISRSKNNGLAERFPSALSQVALDLSDTGALVEWLTTDALAEHVRGAGLALLVNNAGVLAPLGPLTHQPAEAVASAVSLNVAAALALSAAFAQATVGIQDRRILHISSGAGRHAYAGWSMYCASKAALDHHARAVALDRLPRLRISSVAPGVIDTEMQAQIRASDDAILPDRPRFVKMKREGTLLTPEEAARNVVDFLLGDSFGDEVITELR